ncbi:MAG: hypothetical protein IJV45_08225 [Prevotella sp.]|nr:hypothetical protein [Prevotella sp.]
MKKFLRIVISLIAGAVVGLGLAHVGIWLVDGGGNESGSGGDIDAKVFAMIVVTMLVCTALAYVVNTALHEAGHLVGGLLSGYRFLSYRVFSLTLTRDEGGRLCFRRYSLAGTAGQCLMLPPEGDGASLPFVCYHAGGVVMNLVVVVVSVVVLRLTHPGFFWLSLGLMMIFVGLFMALLNGLPLKISGFPNDGRNLLDLSRSPEMRRNVVNQMRVVGAFSQGRRLVEMPREWLQRVDDLDSKNMHQLASQISYIGLLEDEGRYDYARLEAEALMGDDCRLPQLIRMELGGEQLFLELATLRRAEVVDRLWETTLQKYVRRSSRFSAGKQAVLFAVDLVLNGDREGALDRLQTVRQHLDSYAFPGEARVAVTMMENLLKNYTT